MIAERRQLLSSRQAANILGLDDTNVDPTRTVRDMVRRGELIGVKVTNHTMIDADSVQAYIDGNTMYVERTLKRIELAKRKRAAS